MWIANEFSVCSADRQDDINGGSGQYNLLSRFFFMIWKNVFILFYIFLESLGHPT